MSVAYISVCIYHIGMTHCMYCSNARFVESSEIYIAKFTYERIFLSFMFYLDHKPKDQRSYQMKTKAGNCFIL